VTPVSKLISAKKLIVDANILGIFFQSKDFHPVQKAFLEKRWLLSYGGTKQLEEYARVQTAFTLILELQRSGRAFKEETEKIDKREKVNVSICKSDDPHIIALAQVSGARLLCSHDEGLGEDFTNAKLIKPRGKVYKNASHAHLLTYRQRPKS
jgi:hypothetical protein